MTDRRILLIWRTTDTQNREHIHRKKTALAWSCDTDGPPATTIVGGSGIGEDQVGHAGKGTVKKDLEKLGLTWEDTEAKVTALDRQRLASECGLILK